MSIDIAGAGTDSQPLDLSFTRLRHQCQSGDCTACPQAVAAAETMAVTAVTNASAASGRNDGQVATHTSLNQEEEDDDMPSVSSKLCRVYVGHYILIKALIIHCLYISYKSII